MDFDKYSPSEEKRRQERLKRKKERRKNNEPFDDDDLEFVIENPKRRKKKKKSNRPELWSSDDLVEDVELPIKPDKRRRDGDDWTDDDWDA